MCDGYWSRQGQGHIDPQQTPNDSEKMVGSVDSNPVTEIEDVVGPDHSDKSINDKLVEVDHKASDC